MTMTKLPTDVAFDLLVVEQLHDIVKCEWEEEPCGRTAHWLLQCKRCPKSDTLCTPHRVELDEWAGDGTDYVLTCDCGAYPSPPRLGRGMMRP